MHNHLSNDAEVNGWKDQITNQVGINFSLDYRRIILKSGHHLLMAGSEQKLGNVFSYFWPTIRYQFNGKEANGYLPIQYAVSSSSNFTVEASVGFKYEFINLTIEGEPSNKVSKPLDESVIYRALFTAGIGIRYHFKKFSLYFSNNYNSKRIKSNRDHIFGVLGLTYSWD